MASVTRPVIARSPLHGGLPNGGMIALEVARRMGPTRLGIEWALGCHCIAVAAHESVPFIVRIAVTGAAQSGVSAPIAGPFTNF